MIRPVLPEEIELVCQKFTSIDPWITLGATAKELITGMQVDTIRRMLVYDDGVGICGAVIYRENLGAELLFFHNCGQLLAGRHGVEWPCEWTDVPDCGYIGSLAVFDGATGRGIGLQLIQAAEEKIMRANTGMSYLLVSDFNEGAQRFYKRNGYTDLGLVQARRSVEHLMEKAL